MYYILFYKTVGDYIEKRVTFREEHLNLVNEFFKKGKLLMAGAYVDPPDGAALIFKGENPDVAKEFVKQDPYVKNGLITDWHIRQWTVVVGDQ